MSAEQEGPPCPKCGQSMTFWGAHNPGGVLPIIPARYACYACTDTAFDAASFDAGHRSRDAEVQKLVDALLQLRHRLHDYFSGERRDDFAKDTGEILANALASYQENNDALR